jgi:GNAT superfamily N-acetyltransferase
MKSILTWEEKIPNERIAACIAVEQDTIVGWACLSSPNLVSVYVLPEKRRRGIGAQLVRAIHGFVKSRKKVLQAQAHSIAGKKLFLKMQQELPFRVNFYYSAPTKIAPFR